MAGTPIVWSDRPNLRDHSRGLADGRPDRCAREPADAEQRLRPDGAERAWGLRVDFGAQGHPSFYVVSQGTCWLDFDGGAEPIPLVGGDFVLLPKGRPNVLRDRLGSPTIGAPGSPGRMLRDAGRRRVQPGPAPRGRRRGDDPGQRVLRVRERGRNAAVRRPADLDSRQGGRGIAGALAGVDAPIPRRQGGLGRAGAQTIRNRLADILFVQAVRTHIATAGATSAGWLRRLATSRSAWRCG